MPHIEAAYAVLTASYRRDGAPFDLESFAPGTVRFREANLGRGRRYRVRMVLTSACNAETPC